MIFRTTGGDINMRPRWIPIFTVFKSSRCAPVFRFLVLAAVLLMLTASCGQRPSSEPTFRTSPSPARISGWEAEEYRAVDMLDTKEWKKADVAFTGLIEDKLKFYAGRREVSEPYTAEDIARLSPDDAALFWHRGFARRNMMLYPVAKRDYETALSLDPDDLPSYRELAGVCLGMGETAEAAGYSERLLQRVKRRRSSLNAGDSLAAQAATDASGAGNDNPDSAAEALTREEIAAYCFLVRAYLAEAAGSEKEERGAHIERAGRVFDEARKRFPNSPEIILLDADFALLDNRIDDGEKVVNLAFSRKIKVKKLVSLAPDLPPEEVEMTVEPELPYGLYLRGRFLEERGDYEAALKAYTAATNHLLLPATEAYLHRGEVGLYLAHTLSARNDFKRVLSAEPNSVNAWVGIARTQIEEKMWLVAEETLDRLLEDKVRMRSVAGKTRMTDNPLFQIVKKLPARKISDIYVLRARCRAAASNPKRALKDLDAAIELAPGNLLALSLRARLNAIIGNRNAAIEDYRQWAESDGRSPEPLVQFSEFLLESGSDADIAAARQAVEKAVKRLKKDDPRRTGVELQLLKVLLAAGEYDEAARTAKVLLDAAPRLEEGWLLYAGAKQGGGDEKGTLLVLAESVKHCPDSVLLRCREAWQSADLGKLDEALRELEQAQTVAPRSTLPLRVEALVRAASGRLELALRSVQDAVKRDLSDVESRLLRGTLYAAIGNTEFAVLDAEFALAETADTGERPSDALWLKGVGLVLEGRLEDAEAMLGIAVNQGDAPRAAREWVLCRALNRLGAATGKFHTIPWPKSRGWERTEWMGKLERKLLAAAAAGDAATVEKLEKSYNHTETILPERTWLSRALYHRMVLALSNGDTVTAADCLERILKIDAPGCLETELSRAVAPQIQSLVE